MAVKPIQKKEEKRMNFHETVMGRKFYEGDVPRLIKAMEATSKSLEAIAQKLDVQCEPAKSTVPNAHFGLFEWATFSIDDSMLETAEKISMNDEEDIFAEMLSEEISSDTDRETTKLLHAYRMSSLEERKVIDAVTVFLTGWSMATLIERYVERQKQKTEGAWKTQNGFLSVQRNTEGEWDYTLYTPDYKLFDGGLIDDPDIAIAEVRDQILSDFGWSTTDLEDVEYELLEAAVDN